MEPTTIGGALFDMVLEYNTNPNHKTLDRGVPLSEAEKDVFFDEQTYISDHAPYIL